MIQKIKTYKRNSQQRISHEFMEYVEKINKARIDRGLKKLSVYDITLLLTKHNSINILTRDFINYG